MCQKWIVGGMWLLTCASAQASHLVDTIVYALETGPDMQMVIEERYIQEEQAKQAYAGYLPAIEAAASTGVERADTPLVRERKGSGRTLHRREIAFSAKQMLFDGFQTQAEVENALWTAKATAYGMRDTAQAISIAVIEAYIGVLTAYDLMEYTEEQLSHYEQWANQLRQKYRQHMVVQSDVDLMNARLAQARKAYFDKRQGFEVAQLQYKRLTGRLPEIDEMSVTDALVYEMPTTQAKALAIAYGTHPALHKAQVQVAAAKADLKASEASRWPRLDLEVVGQESDNIDGLSGAHETLGAHLKLSYDLFQGGKPASQRRAARREIQKEIEVRNRMRRDIEQNVRLAWESLNTLEEQLDTQMTYINSVNATRDAYEAEYRVGKRSLLDVLDIENERYQANQEYIMLEYQRKLKDYHLLGSMGRLLDALAIPMPEGGDFPVESIKPFAFDFASISPF